MKLRIPKSEEVEKKLAAKLRQDEIDAQTQAFIDGGGLVNKIRDGQTGLGETGLPKGRKAELDRKKRRKK